MACKYADLALCSGGMNTERWDHIGQPGPAMLPWSLLCALYHLLQRHLKVIPVCDGHQIPFFVQILQDQGSSRGELLPDSVLKLGIRDLTSHVHGAGFIVQLDLGLEYVWLGPLLPRLLLFGSCCCAVGCGEGVACWSLAC